MAETTAATLPTEDGKLNSADEKILVDLQTLIGKLEVAESSLRPNNVPVSTLTKNAPILETIGFLEACAPRMVELVEAATLGALSEPVLMKCLEVNDRLMKSLNDIAKVTLVDEEQQQQQQNDFEDFLSASPVATAPAKTDS